MADRSYISVSENATACNSLSLCGCSPACFLGTTATATNTNCLGNTPADNFIFGCSGVGYQDWSTCDANAITKAGFYTLFQTTNAPTAGDAGLINVPAWKGNNGTCRYNFQLAMPLSDCVYYRVTNDSGVGVWNSFITSSNIGSQTVNDSACLGGSLACTYAPKASPLFSNIICLCGSHDCTKHWLHSVGGGSSATEADLMLWASEPNVTYSGVGIANNRQTGTGFPRISTARGGSMMRLQEAVITFENIDASGTAYPALCMAGSTTCALGIMCAVTCFAGSGAGLTGTANSLTVATANNSTCLNGQLGSYYQPASTAINTGNIGSQTVACAGNADAVDGQHFAWSNQSNSPTYLWAANANGSAWLAARAYLCVAYADTAGSAPANGGTANVANVAHTITGCYISGGNEAPSYFGSAKGKLQMLTTPSWSWSDTFWMSSYGGGDVPLSNQLVFSKIYNKAGFRQQNYDSGTWGGINEFWHTGCVSAFCYTNVGSTAVCRNGSGDFSARYITASDFVLSSDCRLKTNIEPIEISPLDIEYKQFELISEPNSLRYGVIAQDLQKVHPELVNMGKDGMMSVSYIGLLLKEVAYLKCKVCELEKRMM